MPEENLLPAIFFDRDGTLIEDTGYLRDPEAVRILPGAVDALHRLQELGYALIVVSNQSGIGRGLISQSEAESVDRRFRQAFRDAGIEFNGVYYCPHRDDAGCECRKPAPGLLRRAQRELQIDLSRSFLIGDKLSDCEAARAAGVQGILLKNSDKISEIVAHIQASDSLLSIYADAVTDLTHTLERFRELLPQIVQVSNVMVEAINAGKKILTCGNGGSAADALHLAEELGGRYKHNRDPLPAICLAADPTLLTCIGNDFGYESVFSRQIVGLGQSGDVLVAFSSSGNSANMLAALAAAKNKQITTIAFLGKDGGQMRGNADYEIIVPSNDGARVQEVHTLVLHLILEGIERAWVVKVLINPANK